MRADDEKARDLLGWTSQIIFTDGPRTTSDWFGPFRREFEALGHDLSGLVDW